MRNSINSVTGQKQSRFNGKLLSISADEREMNNDKKTKYYGATVAFKTASGEIKTTGAVIYANNLKYGMEVGQEYLCTATKLDNPSDPERSIFIAVSHLQGAVENVSDDDFGFDAEITEADLKLADQGIGKKEKAKA